jgi:hypothetical protein
LKLASKGANELPFVVKDKNGGVIFLVLTSLMNNVQVIFGVNCHVVGCLPRVLARKLNTLMHQTVAVVSLTNDDLRVG